MKTKEELEALKQEYEALNNKLKELNEDEIKEIVGGYTIPLPKDNEFWESFNPNFIFTNHSKDNEDK